MDVTEENITELVASYNRPRRSLRSPQEILARYNQALMAYKELSVAPNELREQKITIYAEIKILGWVLGKPEKDVINDISIHSSGRAFG